MNFKEILEECNKRTVKRIHALENKIYLRVWKQVPEDSVRYSAFDMEDVTNFTTINIFTIASNKMESYEYNLGKNN